MIAYKGFDKDLSCTSGGNRFQYKLGIVNKTKEANCAQNGFHCAENPLDCLSYYSNWNRAAYYIVDAAGDINEDGNDSKIACTEMILIQKLTLEDFILESLIYMSNHPTREIDRYVNKDEAEANGLFAIARGKNPIAKGKKGTFLGFAKEEIENHEIAEIAVYKVDGVNILPNKWYMTNGIPYKGEVIQK